MNTLISLAPHVIILAYREDTCQLERFFRDEGFSYEVSRASYSDKDLEYPRAIRCLFNHANAWRRASDTPGYTLVCEADFVPCRGFAQLPAPFLTDHSVKQMAWLYSIGPVIYHYDGSGGFFGHNAGGVAYVLDSQVAQAWLELFEEHRATRDFFSYYQWDVEMPVSLRHRKLVRLYTAYKSYGEHGGIPNPEHAIHGVTSWHQADSLAAPLAFLPAYARGSRLRYIAFRVRSRLRYAYKFFAGKYFDGWPAFMNQQGDQWKRLIFAFRRALT